MAVKQTNRGFRAPLVAAAILILLANPLSGQRLRNMGDIWLKHSLRERQLFVGGYVLGYIEGNGNGCAEGTKDWPVQSERGYEEKRQRKCRETIDFSMRSEDLINLVADFYKRFPGDRDIYPEEILNNWARARSLNKFTVIHSCVIPRHHPGSAPELTEDMRPANRFYLARMV
jgi:hypothetical protein